VLIFPQTIMCGQNMAHMADAPQGNLISATVCPPGVTAPNLSQVSTPSAGMSGM
jgi:hypothetical protein